MNTKPLIALFITLALVSMACGITIDVPVTQIKTGATVEENIRIALPDNAQQTTSLSLTFGAGELKLHAGDANELVSGLATYNVSDFKPRITASGNNAQIEQGNLNIRGIPNFDKNIKNVWDLGLGTSPISLVIKAGAYNGKYELGGLAIKDLEISDGASEVEVSFSEPNLVEMGTFQYTTGASSVKLRDLLNANFINMYFRSGAGSYTFDFSGEAQLDSVVTIESGISNVEIIVSEGTNAVVKFSGGLSNVDADGNWIKNGSTYTHPGSGPTLRFNIQMGAGNIELTTR